jgi:hypothetical protein
LPARTAVHTSAAPLEATPPLEKSLENSCYNCYVNLDQERKIMLQNHLWICISHRKITAVEENIRYICYVDLHQKGKNCAKSHSKNFHLNCGEGRKNSLQLSCRFASKGE